MQQLYLSLLSDCRIVGYRIDPDNGDLHPTGEADVPGEPSILYRHPDHPVLYSVVRSTGHLLSWHIDDDGSLRLASDVDTGLRDPSYLRVDPSGRLLLTAYYESGGVTLHPIDADGTLQPEPSDWHPTALHAHGIAVDAATGHAFVSHTEPGNGIWAVRVEDGLLHELATPFRCPPGTGPRHVHLHPQRPLLYADDEQGNSVTTYRIDVAEGSLERLNTLSTVPEHHRGGACARMELHSSAQWLYVANRGHDSLARFSVDAADGRLHSLGWTPVPSNPRSFTFSPDGVFLYVAGESADQLAAFRVDTDTGDLTRLWAIPTGRVPWWVEATQL